MQKLVCAGRSRSGQAAITHRIVIDRGLLPGV